MEIGHLQDRRAQRDSADWLEVTLRSRRESLLALARRITGDRDEAEDAVQQAFVWIWGHRDELAHGEQGVLRLLHTVARNCAITERRRRVPRTIARVPDSIQSSDPAPDDRILATDLAQVITKALATVPREWSEVFRLSAIEGQSHDE